MKHYLLITVEKPPQSPHEKWQAWCGFDTTLRESKLQSADAGRLSDTVWLLDRDDNVRDLALIIQAADVYRLTWTCKFLRDDV